MGIMTKANKCLISRKFSSQSSPQQQGAFQRDLPMPSVFVQLCFSSMAPNNIPCRSNNEIAICIKLSHCLIRFKFLIIDLNNKNSRNKLRRSKSSNELYIPLTIVPELRNNRIVEPMAHIAKVGKTSNPQPVIPPKRTSSRTNSPLNMRFYFVPSLNHLLTNKRLFCIPFLAHWIGFSAISSS